MSWRIIGAVGAAIVAIVLPMQFLSADTADAAVQPFHTSTINSNGTPLDWCPGHASICSDSQHDGSLLASGTTISMKCWIDARWTDPNHQNLLRWFYVAVGGRQGFVKAERVWNQWLSSPECTTNREVMASLWATGVEAFGQSQASSADRATMAAAPFYKPNTQDTTSGWGPGYDWSGDCSSYAALAWHDGADVNIYFGNAAQMYRYYRGMPGFQTGGVPPRGALVFWQFSTLGHVMVSLGDGEVAGTQGTDGQHLPTFAVPMSYENGRLGATLGWIQPV